jgi:hypothetical protein
VKDVEEKARAFNPRLLLVALAAIFAAVSIWAATALAAGGSSPSSTPATSDDPVAAYVQDDNGNAATPGDCPENGDSSGGSSGSSDSSSTDFGQPARALGRRQRLEARFLESSESTLRPRSGSAPTFGSSLTDRS